ncbi:Serpin (serine protease inhibitor) family protein [Brugia pahangi]
MIDQAVITALLFFASIQIVRIFGEISPIDYVQSNIAVSLLKEIVQGNKSVVLSPISIATELFMIYLAADEETKQQLQIFLGGSTNEAEVRKHFSKLLVVIDARKNENYTLNIANRFYVQQGFSVKESFARVLRFYYGETLHSFSNEQSQQVAQEINNWVSQKTNRKITELITAGDINKNTKMLLLNAIYFSGTWETQFDDMNTHDEIFHISQHETKNVSMMTLQSEFPYYEDHSVQVIKLPYIGEEVEMVFILPKIRFGLQNVLRNLTGRDLLSYISSATPNDVSLKLPKFRLEGKMDLKETLQKIGIEDAISETANFRELTNDAISVGNIMHRGFIEVNEKGTEAAAATMLELEGRILTTSDFIADQPFLFAIVQNLKTVLFAGQFSR